VECEYGIGVVFEQRAEALLAFLQTAAGLDSLGEIDRRADHADESSVRVAHGRVAHECLKDGAVAAADRKLARPALACRELRANLTALGRQAVRDEQLARRAPEHFVRA